MRSTLNTALRLSTGHEGGYVNHPRDPGGPTNHGITQATLSAFIGRKATIADVQNLKKATAAIIYERSYWAPISGDKLPAGLDYAVFDFGVNSGPSRAIKTLQKLLPGVTADGVVGPKTLAGIAAYAGGIEALIRAYCDARMKYLRELRTWPDFGRGWTRRVTGVDPKGIIRQSLGVVGEALKIAQGSPAAAIALTVPTGSLDLVMGKARDVDIKVLAPARNKVQAASIAGAVLAFVSQVADKVTPYKDYAEWVGMLLLGLTIVGAVCVLIMNLHKIRSEGAHA